ncbi:MAG: HlyD family secretion protein [Firmicutes bacterium]|nr:HlyD family secretion protein [Bacillota bacterium]
MKKKVFFAVLALMILALGGISAYYWYKGYYFVITEDAYVDGTLVRVGPQVAGQLKEVYVDEGREVRAGEPVARLDDQTLAAGVSVDLTYVKSPITGTVLKRLANPGEIVAPGQAVVMVADLQQVYITANVEETDLGKVRPGQFVDFTVDSFPGVRFTGRVQQIGEATAATFSLLPTRTTSGTFTKVVQRVPVKIAVDDYQGRRLLPGLSAVVRIHVR